MKKLLLVIFVLSVIFCVTSCVGDIENITDTEKHEYPRTENISAGIKNDGAEFEYSADFDFDGKKEEIEIDFENSNKYDWVSKMEISVGDYEFSAEVEGSCVEAVYICDIDENDGVRDLVVITNEMSDDPVVRIMKYEAGLTRYSFISDYDSEPVDQKWIGYAVSYYFNVNDDDSITMEEQTPSAGMWSVYKTYYKNSDGHFEEKKPEYYEVLPDFMKRGAYENLTGEEMTKWNSGYILARTDYTSNGFTLYKGEYFKVLYDDGENNLYVEKENGDAAWINIGYGMERHELNESFFFLAG